MEPPISRDQSPEKVAARMRCALDLHRAGIDMMRAKLRREHPDESPEQLRHRLNAWLQATTSREQHLKDSA